MYYTLLFVVLIIRYTNIFIIGEIALKGFNLFIKDWLHIINHKQARIAVIVLLLIPLLYAGMFLLGYWDPYGSLNKLPVAVVNLDQGAMKEGKPLHIGEDLITNLSSNKALDFHFVSSDDGEKGLKDGHYYMLVRIPQDFSQKVTTLMDAHPQTANLVYKTNPGNNFIAGQIGAATIDKLKDEVGNEITKSYTQTVFDSLTQLSDGLAMAGNGASQLNVGTQKAENGFHSVQAGIEQLTNGASSLSIGVKPLTEGQAQLARSMLQLSDGSTSLASGLDQLTAAHKHLEQSAANLVKGAKQLNVGMAAGEQGTAQIQGNAQGLTEQLQKYIESHPELANEQDLQLIKQSAESLSKEASSVHDGQLQLGQSMNTLQAGQAHFAAGMDQFGIKLTKAGKSTRQIADGAMQVTNGMDKWQKGFQRLSGGIQALVDGSQKLKVGTVPLAKGMVQLVDGSETLSKSLNTASQKTSGVHTTDPMLSMFSRPIQLVENKINAVPNYGTAMTPYFLTLGLFVGGLIASNIIPFNRKANNGAAGWTHFVNKLCLFLSIALIQTIIVDAVILYGFGIDVLSIPKFLLLSLAAAFTYTSCIFMLVTLFGALGRLAAIFLLVTQLASSGGTFPLQLAPTIIQYVSKCLPMTYAVQGFRSVISTGDWGEYWHNTGVLFWFIAAFLSVALSVILVSNQKAPAEHQVQESHS
jgi:putative membrane protein